jgi:hypothetical protein
MIPEGGKRWRAGESCDDLCRACKVVRMHTIVAVNPDGTIAQVICDYCGSRHHFRGGRPAPRPAAASAGAPAAPRGGDEPLPLVGERERRYPVSDLTPDLETMLRRVIREESGLTAVVPADKWRGGEMVLKPGRPGVQEKTWPIDTFFHKVVMLRNRLRVLEQQVNALETPDDVKVKIQGYITACYGSLTSFNVLFADEDDRFRGSGGGD